MAFLLPRGLNEPIFRERAVLAGLVWFGAAGADIARGHMPLGRLSGAIARLFPRRASLVRHCSTHEGAVGTKAFVESEMPAIVDLFSAFAVRGQGEPELDADGLQKVLAAVGEHPAPETLSRIFTEADTDRSGTIDLAEFLAASDHILGQSPVTRIGVRARARARVLA